ncbi:MAG: hypothetical protein A7316_03125 [Candidatus Altiarchaeales archaeon WOR_SM1_86-2]|nr:MAG: hypothetical protein A7316_03125 [Candidatus Altiarchaeales archaeon WOR_SM1_86-2]ODS41526.1 MAG: hypothetical protein A7315_05810 [Candidatus Altiarchaeales archaeon WOR_SM1_79]
MNKCKCKFGEKVCEYRDGYLDTYKHMKPEDRPRRLLHQEFHRLEEEMDELCSSTYYRELTEKEEERREWLGRLLLSG